MSLKAYKKKLPSDYAILSFRASIEEKEDIELLIKAAQDMVNAKLLPEEKRFKKKDIILAALKAGLKEIINNV